jgi:hypothetical protein
MRADSPRLALLVGLSILGPSTTHADDVRPIHVGLRWSNETGDTACLDQKALAEAVELRLRRSAFLAGPPDLLLEGSLVQEGGKRIARMTLARPDGQVVGRRELESPDPSCATLNEAVPLSVALMIDYQQRIPRFHVPAIEPPERPEPPPPAKPAPREQVPSPAWRFGSRAGISAETGLLPDVTLAPRAAIEASHAWLSLRVEGAWLIPRTASYDAGSVTLTGWTAGAAGCARFLDGPTVESSACLGGEGGRLFAAGARFRRNRDESATLGNAWLGVEAAVPITPGWGLHLGLQGGVPLVPQHLEYDAADGQPASLFESSPVFGRVLLGFLYLPGLGTQKSRP